MGHAPDIKGEVCLSAISFRTQHLLDVLNHLLRIAKLIEIVDEFPFATRGDQIGESRVIN